MSADLAEIPTECKLNNKVKRIFTKKRGKRGGRRLRRKINVLLSNRKDQSYQNALTHNVVKDKNIIKVKISKYENKASKGLKLGLINIQAVGKKSNLIEDLIFDHDFDLFLMTETRLLEKGDEVRINTLTPSTHETKSSPRLSGPGGGISATFKKLLSPFVHSETLFNCITFECLMLEIVLKNRPCVIFCIYRPPPSDKNKFTPLGFVNEFEMFLDIYTSSPKECVLLGDFNLHFDEPNETYVRKMLQILEVRNFSQFIKSPTQRAGHTLDWVVTRNTDLLSNFEITDICISDHFLISFTLSLDKPSRSNHDIMSRNLKSINNQDFCLDLQNSNRVISCSQNKADIYYNELSRVMDRHAPLRERRVTDRPSAPWMTEEIKFAKRERRQRERAWRKSGLPVHKRIFKSSINKVSQLISIAKKTFYQSKIATATSSKCLFNLASDMYGKGKCCILPDNISSDKLPEVFNEFFISKISKIRSLFDSSHVLGQSNCGPNNTNKFCKFRSLSCDEIKRIVLSSPAKSCLLDPIPTKLIFQHIDSIIDSIAGIVNDSLTSGIMPQCFRKAIISPLLKKSNLDPNTLKNYRPVSNLSFVSKIIEKAVFSQINDHLIDNSLYEKHQSAYRKGHNTETALIKITNDLLSSADEKKISIIALLDLSAAFDTIDHTILINRLHNYFGFEGTVLKWFKSYLYNRTQYVKIGNTESSHAFLPFGVPQGSVLGPILYTLYTVPLGSIIRKHDLHYHMYADDTQIYLAIEPKNVSNLVFSLEKCIDEVKNWMFLNKLKLNDEKTEIILCNPKHYDIDCNELIIGNEKISFSNSAKNLGVYLDNDLSMNCHITNICRSVYLEIRRLKHMSRFVDENSLKTLASSFILSKFDYCNALFKNLNQCQIEKMQKLQNFAAKVVLGKCIYDHVTPCFIQLHWLPIKFRIDFKIAITVFKCIYGLAPEYLCELIEMYKPTRNLRSADKFLLKPKYYKFKTLGDRCFSSTAPTVWNALPIEIRKIESFDVFKRELKTHFFREAFFTQ